MAGRGIVVLGTYDGALVGLDFAAGEQVFGYTSHTGLVKTLHCNDSGMLCSGGTDGVLKLYNVRTSMEQGELQSHEDSIVSVRYWGREYLITADKTGQAVLWKAGNYELLQKFRAHKEGVVTMAMHPSGRMMASSGKDKGLRLWDLTRATCAANMKLEEVVEELVWSPEGNELLALSASQLTLVDCKTGEVMTFTDPNAKGIMRVALTACMFVRGDMVMLGDGKGDLRLFQPNEERTELVQVGKLQEDPKRGRIKALVRATEYGRGLFFVVAASSGRVEIWGAEEGIEAPPLDELKKMWTVDTELRITAATLWQRRPRRFGGSGGETTGGETTGGEDSGDENTPQKRIAVPKPKVAPSVTVPKPNPSAAAPEPTKAEAKAAAAKKRKKGGDA